MSTDKFNVTGRWRAPRKCFHILQKSLTIFTRRQYAFIFGNFVIHIIIETKRESERERESKRERG